MRHLVRCVVVMAVCGVWLPWTVGIAAPFLPRSMPAYNQAYRDEGGVWGDCSMGIDRCPDRVATAGCLITSFAMVLDYYGVELVVAADASCTGVVRAGMDPGILNDWLRTRRGYGRCPEDPIGSCCLEWGNLPSEISVSFHENRGEMWLDDAAERTIDDALAGGHPVIAGVHWGANCNSTSAKAEDCHWVVITGKLAQSYMIVDPYNRDTKDPEGVRTLLERGVLGSYVVDRFVVVSGPDRDGREGLLDLDLSFEPRRATYHEGDLQRRLLTVTGTSRIVLLFARVSDPAGRQRYAYYLASGAAPSDALRFIEERRPVFPNPIWLKAGTLEWNRSVLRGALPGTWTWDVWAEDPERPGVEIAGSAASYEVIAGGPASFGVIAIALAIGFSVLIAFLTMAVVRGEL